MLERMKSITAACVCAAALLGVGAAQAGAASRAAWDPQTEPAKATGTIVDVAVGDPDFSTLVAALTAADLVTTLQGKGPYTVFAPTNEAFAKIPAPVLNYLLANPSVLSQVLLYHVVGGREWLRDAYAPVPITTVQGETVYARITHAKGGWKLTINNSDVIVRPIVASNGIIYVIDSVLLPQF